MCVQEPLRVHLYLLLKRFQVKVYSPLKDWTNENNN